VVNDDPHGGRFFHIRPGADAVRVLNNLFSGPGELAVRHGELRNNRRIPRGQFVDGTRFDYRLKSGSIAIGRGIDPGSAYGVALRPSAEYEHPLRIRPRTPSGPLDLGALEYRP
jgi:hypothetical protein